jgi:hypothetical protein
MAGADTDQMQGEDSFVCSIQICPTPQLKQIKDRFD